MQTPIPQEFCEYASRLLGQERYARFSQALHEAPSVSVRLNPLKAPRAGLSTASAAPVPWSLGQGFYLDVRPPFTADPLFHAGAYYVQEAASMFLAQAVRRHVTRPSVVLDLCAAPGGKSTLLRSLLPEGSLLVTNEPIRARAQVLLENMVKWGHPDVVVTNSYPQDFARLPAFFDVVVTDVPCSGEGMFRKEEDAVAGWSPNYVKLCRDRQRDILRHVWPALKPGGLLIYSTCTLNTLEDEENVEWIAAELGAEVLPLQTAPDWGVTGALAGSDAADDGSLSVCRFIPGITRGEGFFIAALRKTDESAPTQAPALPKPAKATGARQAGTAFPATCKSWLQRPGDFEFLADGTTWCALRSPFVRQAAQLRQAVRVWQSGIPVAQQKGRDWQPSHTLAMSAALAPKAFHEVSLSYETAVAYLRRETLAMPLDAPRGIVLLTFRNLPIGFAKNVGGRANNLYPQEWKIRAQELPRFCLAHPDGDTE